MPAGQFGIVGQLKNSVTDTTPNFLTSKLTAGGGISMTTVNQGGNESTTLTAGAGGAISAKAAGFNITAADFGKTFLCTGTFAITFNTAAALAANFSCTIINVGTGTITLTPNAGNADTVLIPGGATAGDASTTLPFSGTATGPYNVSGITLLGDGANPGKLNVVATCESHGKTVFTAGGTWTCPVGVTRAWVTGAAGGGGGGGTAAATTAGAGGGGGAYAERVQVVTVPGTASTVTIGTGGTAGNPGAGGAGNTTSLGALLSLAGGGGGAVTAAANTVAFGGGGGAGNNDGGNAFQPDGAVVTAPITGNGAGRGAGQGGGGGVAGKANTGGGGGGGTNATGGAGGTGFLIVEW